jgi:hypothetical protein
MNQQYWVGGAKVSSTDFFDEFLSARELKLLIFNIDSEGQLNTGYKRYIASG